MTPPDAKADNVALVERLRARCNCNIETSPCAAEDDCRLDKEAADAIAQRIDRSDAFALASALRDLGFIVSRITLADGTTEDDPRATTALEAFPQAREPVATNIATQAQVATVIAERDATSKRHTFTGNAPGVVNADNCQICGRWYDEPATDECRPSLPTPPVEGG